MIGILTNNSKSRSIINGSDRFANFNKTRDIPTSCGPATNATVERVIDALRQRLALPARDSFVPMKTFTKTILNGLEFA
jgi:hypothetical protein